jgi:hypothetical protein
MNKIYQPIVLEKSEEIIKSLIESGFFIDYEIPNTKFAKELLCEKLTEKFINGELSEDNAIFNEDEFENILKYIITGSILYELKTKGLVNSYEDENTEELFFLTERGKEILKNIQKIDDENKE